MSVQTLFEDQIDDEFLKVFDPANPPQLGSKQLEGHFHICAPGEPPQFYLYYFELYDHFIICRKDKGREEVAYMDMLNAIMRRSGPRTINGVAVHGLKFIKKRTYEELFSPSATQIEVWHQALKRCCLLTKFRLHFDSLRVLGRGNFAKVFLVRRRTDGREFAVKAFSKSAVMADPLEVKCLQYEVKMMRLASHERVMRLEELYEGENFFYCVLELFRGPDLLQALVKKGPQPEAKALTIAQQILQGLSYLHSQGVIHRDVKPENILFRGTGESPDIGLVDLGFATLERDYRKLFVRCGTPGYVAPEILADQSYDCKADVFSAGVILYMIISGGTPFHGSSYRDIVRKNLECRVSFEFPGLRVSNEAVGLLRGMLERDPQKRLSSQAALMHPAFTRGLSRSPLITKPASDVDRLLRFKQLTDLNRLGQKKTGVSIPDRIEDLSPMPRPRIKR